MDALQLLRDDHRRVRDLFRQFEEATDASTRKAIVDEAVAELMVHAQLEEEIFYPAMEREGMRDLIDHAEEEHHAAENIMNELFETDARDRELEAKFRVLMDTVNEHVTEEESQIFPRAAEIGMDRLERIGDQLQELRNRIMSTPATERRRPQRRAAASRSRTSTSGRSTSKRSRSTSRSSSTRASSTRSAGSRSTGRTRSGSASTTGGRTSTGKRTGTGRSAGTRSTSRTGTRSSAGARSATGRASSTSRTRSGTSRGSSARSRSSRPSSRSGGTRSSSRSNGRTGMTKEQLYERAQAAGIEGRSTMNKQQLQRALARSK